MRLVLPVGTLMMAAASCCCCGDLFNQISSSTGVDMPDMGGSSMGGSAMPSGMSDVPVYSGASITTAADMGSLSSAILDGGGANPKEVVAFYKSWAQDNGFKIEVDVAMDDTATMQASKGGKKFSATATIQGGTTQIVLSMEG